MTKVPCSATFLTVSHPSCQKEYGHERYQRPAGDLSLLRDQDQRVLALVYSEAAQDPDFKADNDAIERDFAVLDQEVDSLCC